MSEKEKVCKNAPNKYTLIMLGKITHFLSVDKYVIKVAAATFITLVFPIFLPKAATAAFEKNTKYVIFLGGQTMGLYNEIYGKVPEYYPTMYMDGFTPEQIRYALKKKIMREYEDAHAISEIRITSRVKIK